jgi:hypothetical protein
MNAITEFVRQLVGWIFNLWGDDEQVEKVQQLVVVGCGFLPTATSIAAMFAAANPAVTGVLGIAVAICETVKQRPPVVALADFGVFGEVNGVPIEGTFVGKDGKK